MAQRISSIMVAQPTRSNLISKSCFLSANALFLTCSDRWGIKCKEQIGNYFIDFFSFYLPKVRENFSSLRSVQLQVKLRTLGGLHRVSLYPSQPDVTALAHKHSGNVLVEQWSDFLCCQMGKDDFSL
jgi:hypothetical protein